MAPIIPKDASPQLCEKERKFQITGKRRLSWRSQGNASWRIEATGRKLPSYHCQAKSLRVRSSSSEYQMSSGSRAQEGTTRVQEEKGMNRPDLRSKKHHGVMHRLTETAMHEICRLWRSHGDSLWYILYMFVIPQQNERVRLIKSFYDNGMRREYQHKNIFLMMTSCCYLTPISMGKRIQSISLALLNRSFRRSTKIRRRWWQWTEIRANGKDLSTTDKFTYLGSTDRRDGKEHKDINNRLGMTRNAFRILKNTLKFHQYSIKIKVNVYQSCISELYPIIMPWMLKNYRR